MGREECKRALLPAHFLSIQSTLYAPRIIKRKLAVEFRRNRGDYEAPLSLTLFRRPLVAFIPAQHRVQITKGRARTHAYAYIGTFGRFYSRRQTPRIKVEKKGREARLEIEGVTCHPVAK